jgi:type VI secretion system protein ImpH
MLKRQKKVIKTKAEKKSRGQSLLERLTYSPHKFSFTKALDVAMLFEGNDITNITNESISKLNVKSSINFQSKFSDIYDVEGIAERSPEIIVNMIGISGIDGALPDPYDEEYILHNKSNRNAITDFYNIFNNRFITLKYMFLKRHVVECSSVPIDRSLVGNIISSLSGFGFNDKNGREIFDNAYVPHQFKISSQNIFWRNTRSAEFLKIMIASYFNVRVSIEQFVGSLTKSVSKEETTCIGNVKNNFNRLGRETILGSKVWDTTKGIAIHIHSLNIGRYCEFLPKISPLDNKVSPLQKMKEIIKMYVPLGIWAKIIFHLDSEKVTETRLSGIKRLNKDAFIIGIHKEKDTCFIEYVK